MTPVVTFSGDEWRGRVGQSWAAEWVRTDRSFGQLSEQLVDALIARLSERPEAARCRILDIGCGAGDTAMRLTQRSPDLDIVGLDLSDELVAAAHNRGRLERNLSFVAGNAADWRTASVFDAALSRHGVMFFDDPVAAFAHFRGLLRPGAPFVFTCFAARAENPWATEIAELIGVPPALDPHVPGPFAFADAGRVDEILRSAGWREGVPERIEYRYVAGSGADPVGDAHDFFLRIGPAARHVAMLDAAARQVLDPRLRNWLATKEAHGEVSFPAAAWLWRATA